MEIHFRSKKLAKTCSSYEQSVKIYGKISAQRLHQRLNDLKAVVHLEDMRVLPGRCHELKGNLSGMLSLDLEHPYRLLFVPDHDPIPRKDDGGLDWSQITAIEIVRVEDTHG